MSHSDPVIDLLTKYGPLSSTELRELLKNSPFKIKEGVTSKRLERLFKKGIVGRYLRLERGAYIYYLPEFHSVELLQKSARELLPRYSRLIGRILAVLEITGVLSIFEIGRLANISFFTRDKKMNPRILRMVQSLKKSGAQLQNTYLITRNITKSSEISRKIADYEATLDNEAYLLSSTRRLFINKKKAQGLTIFRRSQVRSIAEHKFDMYGHGGWKKPINIIVECNLRREVTTADLIGYDQRVGGTIKRSLIRTQFSIPTARYYIANSFSKEAKEYAKKKGIRRYNSATIINGDLVEEDKYERRVGKEIKKVQEQVEHAGRYKQLKGLALENEVAHVCREEGYKYAKRGKTFFLDGDHLTEKNTGQPFTDIDVFARKESEILLIECKSSVEMLSWTKLTKKIDCYSRIARFLEEKLEIGLISIMVIADLEKRHREDLRKLSSFPVDFITLQEFYEKKQEFLKGVPGYVFGLEKRESKEHTIKEAEKLLAESEHSLEL